MTEYRPSHRKLVLLVTAGVALFAVPAVFGADQPPVVRTLEAVLAVGCLILPVNVLRTRIIVEPNEVAIRRGFGSWFRAAPNTVTVKWTPIVHGLGRGHAWALSVVRKGRSQEGVQVALSMWHPATVDALRHRLDEVTGSAT